MTCNYTKTTGFVVGISDTTLQTPLCIMKSVTFLALWCLMAAPVWASHLLGGQIQTKNISGNTYEITMVLFMDEANGRTASEQTSTIPVCLGDGNIISAVRLSRRVITNQNISVNNYRFTYTYAGPGVYRLSIGMENRTPMANLSQAVASTFSLATTIQTRSSSQNTTPVFEPAPAFWGVGTNQRASLSFRATDVDGDSLTYTLTKPLTNTPNAPCKPFALDVYQYPNDVSKKGTYKLNAQTGELVWDAPTMAGQYSAVVLIREWRAGALIGETFIETFIRVQDKAGTPSPIPLYEPAAEVGIITGTDPEADNGLLLSVSPNPVQSQFVARLRSNKATKATLQLLDLSGRVVAEKALNRPTIDHETTFLVENLPSGLYVLKADVGGRILSQKVMKQ